MLRDRYRHVCTGGTVRGFLENAAETVCRKINTRFLVQPLASRSWRKEPCDLDYVATRFAYQQVGIVEGSCPINLKDNKRRVSQIPCFKPRSCGTRGVLERVHKRYLSQLLHSNQLRAKQPPCALPQRQPSSGKICGT